MRRSKLPRVPKYRLKIAQPSGRKLALVTLSGKDHYLGDYDTDASRAEYNRLVAEWLARHGQPEPSPESPPVSVNEVLLGYLRFCDSYYRRDGEPGREVDHVKAVAKIVRELFGETPAVEFGPLRLRAVRQKFIDLGYTRTHVNQCTQRVRRIFKWAVADEMIPPTVHHGLSAVPGIRRGQGGVKEGRTIRPVPDAYIDAVLATKIGPDGESKPMHVSPEIATMIQLQRLTGMRSGEVCIMRTCDIDTSGETWCYRPARHKTENHGHVREVWMGPRAQEILRPWLRTNLMEPLFSPRRSTAARYAACRTHRHQPVKPKRTKKRIGDKYSTRTYYRAVRDACAKVFPLPDDLRRMKRESVSDWKKRLGDRWPEVVAWRNDRFWHPHQLRHNAATEIRKAYGLEVARAVLGQKTITAAAIYAEMDRGVARNVAAKIG